MSSVFTKIINGEIPGRFVYRDERIVAFLTIEPLRYGHVLVVPVEETNRWTDLAPGTWMQLNEVAQNVGRAVIEAFGSSRAGYIIAGFDVAHTHIHVFPTDAMSDYDFSHAMAADATDPALMDNAAQRIRTALETDDNGYPQLM
ncbi:HIT family protein [Corynebacterium alimapuense]|uniref:HIT family protein n=1 Tax=Corynebacterium alimapuense TaxID=1576874 RepID=A0A3M8K9E2_9CORY|nr:HIT family protein [Corynebacterium alimapuense]RNE49847.1 HIT family protein [Corynebacterium alimapuense]